tara:strand:+ start:283 stop:435 length:153 start_codon:yes stop_codon:yes gene_type:complete
MEQYKHFLEEIRITEEEIKRLKENTNKWVADVMEDKSDNELPQVLRDQSI